MMPASQDSDTISERLVRWDGGEPPGPWNVNLFPTNRCNLRCAICWQRSCNIDYSCEVPDERLLEVVDECADLGAREWSIVGGGEPMMRAGLVLQLCERIRARNMNGLIQTNGTLFTAEHLTRLIDMGWSSLLFSLDGPTLDVNDEIRSAGSFEKATATIRQAAELKRVHQAETPLLSLHATLTNLNYDKLDRLVELARDLGCDGVGAGVLTGEGEARERFRLREEHLADLPAHIERATRRAEELGVRPNFSPIQPVSGAGYRDKLWNLLFGSPSGLARAFCYEPWLNLTILADGKAGPCCVFWDTQAQNIQGNTVKDVWLGPYFRQLREDFVEGRLPDYCANCPANHFSRDTALQRELRWMQQQSERVKMNPLQRLVFAAAKVAATIRRNAPL